jgi:hypothetical protein
MLILRNQQLFQTNKINAEKNNVKKISVDLNNNDINNINNIINNKTEDLIVKNINKRNILITLPLDLTRHFLLEDFQNCFKFF